MGDASLPTPACYFNKYLLWFANEHVDFRVGELKAILSILELDIPHPECIVEPFLILELPSEHFAFEIAQRSVTLRSIIELWAESTDIPTLHARLKSLPSNMIKSHFAPDKTFKIKVDLFCNSQTAEQKLEKIESFHYLPIEGSVRLKNPDVSLQYIEYFGLDPNNAPDKPLKVFFGRKLSNGRRDIITELSLKSRRFIGNTSMDAQLSLIMANEARVLPGDLIFDPFVGSGSLLISAAYFGAYVFGCDIDFMMLHGKTRPTRKQVRHIPRQNESVRVNFEQYGLRSRYLDVLVADSSAPLWRDDLQLDAIITDPPYGIREATEKVGAPRVTPQKSDSNVSAPQKSDSNSSAPQKSGNTVSALQKSDNNVSAPQKSDNDVTVPQKSDSYASAPQKCESNSAAHYPSKVDYSLPDILSDLMAFAAKHLKLGGRLVYWLPVIRSEYCAATLPRHSCFLLVSNSEQVLSTHTARRLLTYEKTQHPPPSAGVERVVEDESVAFREKFFTHALENRQMKRKKKMENFQRYQMKIATQENQKSLPDEDSNSGESEELTR